MSIEEKDKEKNDHLEEDTLALRAVSSGNRKNKKPRQTRTSDQSPNIPASERSSETKHKSNGTEQKAASPSGKEAVSDISDTLKGSPVEEKGAVGVEPVEEKEPARELTTNISDEGAADLATPATPVVPEPSPSEKQPDVVGSEQPTTDEQAPTIIAKLEQKIEAAPVVPEPLQARTETTPTATQPETKEETVSAATQLKKEIAPAATTQEAASAVTQSEAKDQSSTPEALKPPPIKEVEEPVVPASSIRGPSIPAIPKRPQAKGQSTPAIPKRPSAKGQTASPEPKTSRVKEEAALEPAASDKAELKTPIPDERIDTPLPEKHVVGNSTAALSKQEMKEWLETSRDQKENIADISTTAISKQEVEEGLAAARAQKEHIAEQPTTVMSEKKAPDEKVGEKVDKQPAPADAEKHIADISTAAISKQEVQEQLAAARARKDLAEKASKIVPEPKKDAKKGVADQPTRATPGPKDRELPDTPPLEKHLADISTTAISKQEVEEGLAAARAQKENGRKPVPPQVKPEVARTPDTGTPDKGVAVLTRNSMLPGVVAPSRPDPVIPHRTRVNRLLIRRRRHERTKEIAPRLITAVAVILILLTSMLSSSAGAAYAYYQSQLPLLNGIADHSLFQTTHIYDRNGKLLYELYDQQLGRGRRTYVNYNDVSPLLVNATIAIEDRTFWTNNGVDPVGIARAGVQLAQNNGDVQGGGSTVTQQLIKNQFFDNQPRTFPLKAEEAMLAAGLTQQYPKWKIMEMYLNTVYYGNIDYGAEAAAEDYFGLMPKCDKTRCVPGVAQLDLAQASMLAGLPQSPTNYDPIDNKPAALARQKAVLQAMVETGKITPVQAQQAANEMAKYNFISYAAARRAKPQAPHFVSYVIDQLTNLLGAQTLISGGFNVYTSLDLDLEKKVEQIVYYHIYQQQDDNYVGFYGILSRDKNVNNGAVVVMNPYNGEILAMDGSANYSANNPTINGQVNAAVTARQPGSSMKPIVYATAFEMGWSPGMIVPDHKTVYPYPDPAPPKYYTPQNYDGTFHTSFPMTIRTAVSNSYNIPALDTLMYAGIPNVQNMAGRLGLPEIANAPASQLGVSLALGAREVSLLHLTNAYSTFANQGVRVPPVSILEITDNQGRPLYKYNESHPQGIQAVGSDVAFMISSMLSDKEARYHEFSPGNPLELDRPAAAKTGTTDSFRDNWTMGYTPHLAVGVWVGNSNNDQMNNIIGITGAGPIWHDVIEYASQRYNLPPDDFVRPKNVHAGSVSAVTGLVPRLGESTVTDWYIDGTLPTIQGSNYSVPTTCTKKHCKNNNNNNGG